MWHFAQECIAHGRQDQNRSHGQEQPQHCVGGQDIAPEEAQRGQQAQDIKQDDAAQIDRHPGSPRACKRRISRVKVTPSISEKTERALPSINTERR